jgi:dipeptidyl aminopeptidase/acylaminoacyl peptidase
MTADRRKVLILSSSDVDAGTYTYLNRDKGSLGLIAETMPGLPPELMSLVEPVSFAARDGWNIPACLTVPKGMAGENLPVVVMPHGGPRSRDDNSFWFLSQFLASRG